MGFLKFMRCILLFLCILCSSCKYNVSDPLMPLKDYTAGKGITYYISSSSSVADIEETLKKNKHSLGKYKLVVDDETTETAILTNISNALNNNPSFNNVEIDITKTKITEIPEKIFAGTKISSISLPNTITNIKKEAFSNCSSLNNIRFSSELVEVGEGAFKNCVSLTIAMLDSEKLTTIGKDAFNGCSSLVNLILGKGITSIDCSSLTGCTKLEKVQYMGNTSDKDKVNCSPFSGSGAANPKDLYLPGMVTKNNNGSTITITTNTVNTPFSFLGKSWQEANIHYSQL